VEKPDGKRSLRTPKHRWEDNIRMDLKEMVGTVRTRLICHRIGKCFESGNEPSRSIKL
jgi:hypothetical protein